MASPLFILYGSATGNAEHIAKDLAERYRTTIATAQSTPDSCHFDRVICTELNKYKKECSKYWNAEPKVAGTKYGVIIVTSTTGNADAPENADRFVRYVKRRTTVAAMPFRHCAYAVLGLGDTNYDQFCAVGRVVDAKLAELGGTRVRRLGMADEATGLEEVVEPWVEGVVEDVERACRGGDCVSTGCTGGTGGVGGSKAVDSTGAAAAAVAVGSAGAAAGEEEKKSEEASSLNQPGSGTSSDAVEDAVKCEGAAAQPQLLEHKSSSGVDVVRALLSVSNSEALPSVPHNLLPSLGPSLSSCALIDHRTDESTAELDRDVNAADMDRMTISTASTSNVRYTINHPYESAIVKARYLTDTSTDGAMEAAAILRSTDDGDGDASDDASGSRMMRAMECIDSHFPLEVERNGKRVMEMSLELPDDFSLEYQPGDSIGLIVPNPTDAVDFVLGMLQKFHGISSTHKISVDEMRPTTVAEAVRAHVDISSPVKNKRILFFFSQVASDPEEESVLRLLSSKIPEGEALFEKYVDEQRMTAVDILRAFPSCQSVTLEGLLGALPKIAPRYYSVTSSPLSKGGRLSLTVAFSVVDYLTPPIPGSSFGQRRIRGVATRYLECLCSSFLSKSRADQEPPAKLKIFAKPTSDFHLPVNLSTPLILIGPGTGVAPFIGFLSHRQGQIASNEATNAAKASVEGTWRGGYDLEEDEVPVSKSDGKGLKLGLDFKDGQRIGDIDLFFGCRHKDHDWLYRDEMLQLQQDGILTNLHAAFSRDDGAKRTYVTHKLKEAGDRVRSLILEQNASVYICGDGNAMAKDVQEMIVDLLLETFDGDDKRGKAEAYLAMMKKTDRLVLDIWS